LRSEFQIRQDILEVGRRLYNRGLVASHAGNISVRVGENEILTTPHGVSKGFMTAEMIVKVDLEGRVVAGTAVPSSEIMMHLEVYKNRPDAGAVVHAHPPVATGFAVAGLPLDSYILPEIIIGLGTVPLCEYGTPSTMELAASIRGYLPRHDALLLANHGALAVGSDVFDACYKMESIEMYAQISLTARQLGVGKELSQAQIERLREVREKMGLRCRHPGLDPGADGGNGRR